MPHTQEFSEHVPEHIKPVVITPGFVEGGRWLPSLTGQPKIAKALCLNATDEAKLAWNFFYPKNYQLIVNGLPVETEAGSIHAAQRSFVLCLFFADFALNRWDEHTIITPSRLAEIERKAAELSKLISGINSEIPREPAGWRLNGDRRETIYRNGWGIQSGLAQLYQWARGYIPPEDPFRGSPFADIKRVDRLRWFARKMLNGNPPQKAASLAALTNVIFADEPECANGGISKEIIREGKL